MKKALILLSFICIFFAFGFRISAKESEDYISEFESAIPEEIEIQSDGAVSMVGFDALFGEALALFQNRGGEIVSFFLLLLSGIAISSLTSHVSEGIRDVCEMGVGLVFSTLVFKKIAEMFFEVSKCIEETAAFFSALVPIMTGISAASGSGTVATVQNAGMSLTLFIITSLAIPAFSAVVGFLMATSLVGAVSDEGALSIGRGVKSVFTFCVGALTTTVGAVMSLQTVVASATDNAAMRAVRYAASGMIPVVGSAVSGSLSTLSAGMAYAKSVVGAGGVAVILAMALSPLIMLLLYRLALSLALGISDMCAASSSSRLFSSFRMALDAIIAIHAVCSVIFIFEIIVFMKGGISAV